MGGYILNREGIREKEQKKLYRQGELELMTTHQLREICRREKIVHGILNPLDKEELVHVIMRYRGTREQLLIRQDDGNGREALEKLLSGGRIRAVQDKKLHIPSRMIVYEGRTMDENDRICIPYRAQLEDTNAVLVSGGRMVCGIFYLCRCGEDREHLYVMKHRGVSCREADRKDYDLYCFSQQDSDRVFSVWSGLGDGAPEELTAYRIPLMDVEVREPVALRMPLVVDFGSTNTTAGVYLDSLYFEQTEGAPFTERFGKEAIQHTVFEGNRRLMPSVAGVVSVDHGQAQFVFGQAAVDLSNACYVDEGFSIFYDMKRWISDYGKEEEITDREGRRTFLARREIIRAYFRHIITATEDQFKCRVGQIQVSCPVKQKFLFQKLFREILPEYAMREEETGYVSRNLEDVTLQLFLKDTEGRVRYRFHFDCAPERFKEVTYEEIQKVHGGHILQKETDSIVNREIRFFVWKRCRDWGYVIVPVCRKEERLYMGDEQFYPFEHEGWVKDYFDGMK